MVVMVLLASFFSYTPYNSVTNDLRDTKLVVVVVVMMMLVVVIVVVLVVVAVMMSSYHLPLLGKKAFVLLITLCRTMHH